MKIYSIGSIGEFSVAAGVDPSSRPFFSLPSAPTAEKFHRKTSRAFWKFQTAGFSWGLPAHGLQ